jgi:hypothetical protein
MKKITLLFSVLFFFSGCRKESRDFIDVRLDRVFDIPAGLNNLETHFFVFGGINSFFAENMAARNLSVEDVVSITASRGTFTIPDGFGDLDIFRRISIFAKSRTNPTLEREMFYLDFVPFNVGLELRLLTSISELQEILSEESFDLELRLEFKNFTALPTRIRFDYGYRIFYEL